ncbi:MAG TPA: class I SAM-dependent methyltransferase [Gemmatimonadaceae bacterium]|nr:class I SAM-dependent methyltransferase [Gemmatimonadaceae bacterium]
MPAGAADRSPRLNAAGAATNVAVKPCPICDGGQAVHERWLDSRHAAGGPFELARCTACSFVFTNLLDDAILRANAGFDDEDTASYESSQSAVDRLWFDHICERLARATRQPRPRVLDVGCGNGLLIERFERRGWEVAGVDLSSWAERAARQMGFRLYRGTIETAPLPTGYFDVVTSTSTLEHIPKLVPHVEAVLRVLKPGGQAYFAGMPNYGSLSVRAGLSAFHHNRPPRHANWFTPRTLRRLFAHPAIRPGVARLSVRTYGIPELHRLYAVALARLRGSRHRGGGPLLRGPANGGASQRVLRWLVQLNYHGGRPLGVGDKLELVVTAGTERGR